jgi:hypothetical protein
MIDVRDRVVHPGRTELARTVRSKTVVLTDKLREHSSQVPLTEDRHAVSDFGPGGPHKPLGEAVRLRKRGGDIHPSGWV